MRVETLAVTNNTVKHHLKQMFFKMQAGSRSELLGKAFSSSLGSQLRPQAQSYPLT